GIDERLELEDRTDRRHCHEDDDDDGHGGPDDLEEHVAVSLAWDRVVAGAPAVADEDEDHHAADYEHHRDAQVPGPHEQIELILGYRTGWREHRLLSAQRTSAQQEHENSDGRRPPQPPYGHFYPPRTQNSA